MEEEELLQGRKYVVRTDERNMAIAMSDGEMRVREVLKRRRRPFRRGAKLVAAKLELVQPNVGKSSTALGI